MTPTCRDVQKLHRALRFLSGWGVLLAISLLSTKALCQQPTKETCVRLYRKQNLQKAARCFRSLGMREKAKYKKGRHLRNAGLLFQRAAKGAPTAQARGLLYQAERVLALYLKERLCEVPERCAQLLSLQEKLQRELKYARLHIKVRPEDATIRISGRLHGQLFRAESKGACKHRLLPGRYTARIFAEGRQTRLMELVLHANKIHTLNISLSPVPRKREEVRQPTKPPPKKTLPPLVWVGYIGGGVAVVTGAILLGAGASHRGQLAQRWEDPKQFVSVEERDRTLGEANAMFWSGGLLLAAGVGLVVVGVVSHTQFMRPKKATDRAEGVRK